MTGLGLAGRNALVTGGTRGIGRSIALALAGAGAGVLTCYRREGEAAERLARDLKQLGGDHHVVQADLRVPADVERLADTARERFGSLHVVVNNAAAISHVPFEELPLDEWRTVVDTGLTAAFLVVQKILPLLADGASIVNVGSRVALVGIPLRAHYTAAKAGLVGLTRSLCKELGPRRIRVNVVAPGIVEDDRLTDAKRERYQGLTALGRLGDPDEVAAVVLFLASDLSRYVTGDTIHVDGGI